MLATSFRPTAGVYALVDPRDGRTMYIGQSVDVEYRYRQHCDMRNADGNPAKHAWISSLYRQGLAPTLVILERVGWPDSDDVEQRLIREYKERGECEFNRAGGGMNNRSVSRPLNSHPDDWFQVGIKIKRARALLSEAIDDAGRLAGATEVDKGIKASRAIDHFKYALEGVMSRVFPGMPDLARVFSGPESE